MVVWHMGRLSVKNYTQLKPSSFQILERILNQFAKPLLTLFRSQTLLSANTNMLPAWLPVLKGNTSTYRMKLQLKSCIISFKKPVAAENLLTWCTWLTLNLVIANSHPVTQFSPITPSTPAATEHGFWF